MEPISVKSLHDDRGFRSSITCQKLEELYELMHSGLKMDEIYAVEFIGGATVVPKLQARPAMTSCSKQFSQTHLFTPLYYI
ncbi:heat shock 70 kDa protein 17-like [Citrus clementina]|uniref:heat shock 70 kDa protein 17-like n=1 Tax=Citrus clementina TaxID=85681 RepID=UPI000CED3A96|nr:heat shock 70 kDa protein 17-like [Citrus x clementina]